MRARRGFTLWEMAIVLALTALTAAIVIPSWSDLGANTAPLPGDALVALLRDARRLAIDRSQTVAVRLDPTSLYYRVDTTGAWGTGAYVDGTLAVGTYESFVTDLPRLQYVFRPTGSAIGDTVLVRGDMTVLVSLDTWSGQVVRYAR